MAPRPPPRKQISTILLFDVSVPISSSTPLESSGLNARVANTPLLADVVDMLRKMEKLIEQMTWNKEQCLQLKEKSLVLLLVICDHCESGRSEKPKLESVIKRTAATFSDILTDLNNWTKASLSETKRDEILATTSHHDRCIRRCMDHLSLPALLQIHDPSIKAGEPLAASPPDERAQPSVAPGTANSPTQITTSAPLPPARKQTTVQRWIASSPDRGVQPSTAPLSDDPLIFTPRPQLKRESPSVNQPFDIPVVVSADTVFDVARLAACCAPVPGLAPVVETLRNIFASVERVSWNKDRCRKLGTKAMTLVFVISDHYDNERVETPKLQSAIESTVQAMQDIEVDVRAWAAVSFPKIWSSRQDVEKRITEHEEKLKSLTESLSLAATVQTASSPDRRVRPSIAPLSDDPPTFTPRPQLRRQSSSVNQLLDIPVVVSADTVFDVARLAACCAPVPGLAPVVETLRNIDASVERVSWGKSLCRELSIKAMKLVFIICDHYDNERAETPKLQNAIEGIVQAMQDIEVDVRAWAALLLPKIWSLRHDVEKRITEHEEKLKKITEALSLAATVKTHDRVAALQESLKSNPSGREDRKRAEEQLYRLRNAAPGELAALTPPELACECIRLGSQPEHSGPRNDIWKGRWLDKLDVALIFCKDYKMGARDDNGIRRFERHIKVWRRLDNPYVLRLYGWCKFDGETYLVSPWMRNRDVLKYLDGDRNRHKKCLALITEIALGLRYLYNQDIVHGSLKPSNILVRDDGRAVISDFSLAKLATPDVRNTQANPQVSVFRYQAPEVILDEPISKASDVYSWAMTALEIITGDPPFSQWKTAGQLVAQVIMKRQIPNRSDYESPVLDKHPEIWNLFVRSWNRVAVERPTAKEIVEVLESIPASTEY